MTQSSRVLLALLMLLGGALPAASQQRFDHAVFDALLHKHVVNGLVDYDGFARAPEFAAYLRSFDAVDPAGLPEPERLAYWIDAYNAFTIQLINGHHERASIRNVNESLGLIKGHGPWREPIVKAGGKLYHLDNVEHDVIRKQFKEPRIHFALVCAALGCPPLRSEAFTGAGLDAQLEDQAVLFLTRSPEKNRVDLERGIFRGSPIFVKYYREDFGGSDAAIMRYLARFYPAGPERELLASGRARLEASDYDWTLNSQEQARTRR